MPNTKNPYKKHEGSAGATGIAAAAAGADTAFQNPGDAVQNGLKAWSMHRFMKARKAGNEQALKNEAKASKNAQQMSTGQVKAGSLKWGENGITEANGYVRDKDGGIRYVGKKK
ncbi:hypothetical protein BDV19DRAFT_395337 [Aspergillus venezuelensis]